MSEKRILQLSKELQELTRVAQTIRGKYVAHMGLHSAALLEGDKEQMLEHRKAMHVLLDRMLDNGEAVQRLSDEMVELSRG